MIVRAMRLGVPHDARSRDRDGMREEIRSQWRRKSTGNAEGHLGSLSDEAAGASSSQSDVSDGTPCIEASSNLLG